MFTKNLLIVFALFFALNANAKMYGVFYGKNGDNLCCPENDVTDLADLYRKNGGQVILIRGNGVTKNQVYHNLVRQTQACTSDDIFIFAYSGHGNKGAIDCGNEVISFNQIKRVLTLCKARRKVIILDACYSGSFTDTCYGTITGDNVIIISASRSNEQSVEFGQRNSPFYTALITGLKGEADTNSDGMVVAKELFTYISNNVKKYNLEQHPTMKGKFDENIILYTYKKKVNKNLLTYEKLGLEVKKKDKLPIELSYANSIKLEQEDDGEKLLFIQIIITRLMISAIYFLALFLTFAIPITILGVISIVVAKILVFKRKRFRLKHLNNN